MTTEVTEVGPKIYRLTTRIPRVDIPFNQFLIDADEPLLFHTGMHGLFPSVSAAVARLMPLERLRWITFGHYEADECGAMNDWLKAAPQAQVAHGALGVGLSIDDQALRPARGLKDGEVLDLGGKRMRRLETPHVPHGWDAGLFFEETTQMLFTGDLFTTIGESPAVTSSSDFIQRAVESENDPIDGTAPTALTPFTAKTIRRLAELKPKALSTMHAATYEGDAAAALRALADHYEARLALANRA